MISDRGAVIIETSATNLATGITDTNGVPDILYREPNGDWQYLSIDASGTPVGGRDPHITPDGKWCAWVQGDQPWIYNTETGDKFSLPTNRIFGIGPVRSGSLSIKGISANGRYLLFSGDVLAPNRIAWLRQLVYFDRDPDANGVYDDVFVAGRVLISLIGNIDRLPSIEGVMSSDGHTVAATITGTPSLQVFHMPSGRTLSLDTGVSDSPAFALNEDGRYIAYFHMRAPKIGEIRLWDTLLGTSQVVSIDAFGRQRLVPVSRSLIVSNTGTQIVFSASDGDPSNPWIPGDTNQFDDVFLRVIDEGKTIGLTVGSGTLNNEAAGSVHTNRDGSITVFASPASNLVPDDTNGVSDIFIRFADGSLRRIMTHAGDEPNGPSYDPKISSDGNWVVFRSYATNMTPEGGNGFSQVYLYSIATNQLWLVSRSTAGQPGNGDSHSPSISRDGLFVAFASSASNLVFGDRNNDADIFVYSRSDGRLFRIAPRTPAGEPIDPNGPSGDPAISDDGRWIAFGSPASNYVNGDTNGTDDIFVYDRITGRFTRITKAGIQLNGASYQPSISGDGRYVAFASQATNIDPRDTDSLPDIYVWDRNTGTLTLASVNSFGRRANLGGRRPSISLDGTRVAFESDATNLMPLDGTPDTDIFVYDATTGWVYPVSARGCIPGDAPSFFPVLSGDGRIVAFQTTATNLSDLPIGANAYVVMQQVICVPPGDVNRDGIVDDADLLQALFDFGQQSSCADVTMDGIVDDADLLVVLFNFGLQCTGSGFLYGGNDDERRFLTEALLGEPTEIGGYASEDGYYYRGTAMTPALVKSLERQAAEIAMMHQGRWPYPVAGRGSEPWVAAYGDPLTMSEEELQALLEQFHNPPQQGEGDFFPASGSWSYNEAKSVQLGGSDINISVNGSIYLFVSCTQAKMEARGDANIKFFSLNYRVADAYGLAEASNTQAKIHGYFRVAGNTIWSFGPQTWNLSVTYATQCHYGGTQRDIGPWSWSTPPFNKTWFLGPVPVRVTAGFNLEAGACYKLHAQLAPIRAEARFRPYVRSSAFATGGVAFSIGCSASAGVGINLNLLDYALEAYVSGQIGNQNNRCCAQLTAGIHNTITALRGRFYIYAEACCWGLSGPSCGLGRKRQRWQWDLFNWNGISQSGHLWGPWNHTHCF
jgi:Tol biopolymer transport system component